MLGSQPKMPIIFVAYQVISSATSRSKPAHFRQDAMTNRGFHKWGYTPVILILDWDFPQQIPSSYWGTLKTEVLSQLLSLWRDEGPGEGRGLDVCRELAPGVGSLKKFVVSKKNHGFLRCL